MARIRSIKPEFCVSEQLAECSTNARLVFALMWMFCDDQGIHPAKPRTLKGEIFPLDESITTADVQAWVNDLIQHGLLREYEVGADRYWIVTGWSKHQKIDKPSRKHPLPLAEDSPSPPRKLADASPPEGKGKESKGREETTSPAKSATVIETSAPPEPPARALPPGEFPKPDDPRVTALHGLCLGERIQVRTLQAQQWVADGVTEDLLRAAIDRGKLRKNGAPINVPFLQLMVQDVRSTGAGYDPEAVKAQALALMAKQDSHAAH